MATNTPNIDLTKPAIDDPNETDMWGGQMNSNMDTLDSILGDVQSTLSRLGSASRRDVGTASATLPTVSIMNSAIGSAIADALSGGIDSFERKHVFVQMRGIGILLVAGEYQSGQTLIFPGSFKSEPKAIVATPYNTAGSDQSVVIKSLSRTAATIQTKTASGNDSSTSGFYFAAGEIR